LRHRLRKRSLSRIIEPSSRKAGNGFARKSNAVSRSSVKRRISGVERATLFVPRVWRDAGGRERSHAGNWFSSAGLSPRVNKAGSALSATGRGRTAVLPTGTGIRSCWRHRRNQAGAQGSAARNATKRRLPMAWAALCSSATETGGLGQPLWRSRRRSRSAEAGEDASQIRSRQSERFKFLEPFPTYDICRLRALLRVIRGSWSSFIIPHSSSDDGVCPCFLCVLLPLFLRVCFPRNGLRVWLCL